MKLRVAKSEVEFYINRLLQKGFTKVSLSRVNGTLKVVMKDKDSTLKVLTFTSNGWLSIQ